MTARTVREAVSPAQLAIKMESEAYSRGFDDGYTSGAGAPGSMGIIAYGVVLFVGAFMGGLAVLVLHH